MIVGGLCFILPAVFIVTALAWAYVRFGSLPEVSSALYGIKSVIIAIILQALWNLGQKAVKGPPALAAVPFSLSVLFLNFLKIGAVLYGSGYVLLAFRRADRR